MKIEIYNQPIGIPAKFNEDKCVTHISAAHEPLVALEAHLTVVIDRFIREKKFSNSFKYEFIEQIDSRLGICVVCNLHIVDSESIFDFDDMSLRTEFEHFLLRCESKSRLRDNNAEPQIKASFQTTAAEAVDTTLPYMANAKTLSFFADVGDRQERTPVDYIAGECFSFNRFNKTIGAEISTGKQIEIKIEDPAWLLTLADASKKKNSSRLRISAIADGKICARTRTLMSYSKFVLVEEPIVRTL